MRYHQEGRAEKVWGKKGDKLTIALSGDFLFFSLKWKVISSKLLEETGDLTVAHRDYFLSHSLEDSVL